MTGDGVQNAFDTIRPSFDNSLLLCRTNRSKISYTNFNNLSTDGLQRLHSHRFQGRRFPSMALSVAFGDLLGRLERLYDHILAVIGGQADFSPISLSNKSSVPLHNFLQARTRVCQEKARKQRT